MVQSNVQEWWKVSREGGRVVHGTRCGWSVTVTSVEVKKQIDYRLRTTEEFAIMKLHLKWTPVRCKSGLMSNQRRFFFWRSPDSDYRCLNMLERRENICLYIFCVCVLYQSESTTPSITTKVFIVYGKFCLYTTYFGPIGPSLGKTCIKITKKSCCVVNGLYLDVISFIWQSTVFCWRVIWVCIDINWIAEFVDNRWEFFFSLFLWAVCWFNRFSRCNCW